jgi:hypothetical protein
MILKIWKDPVWSKVIATGIITVIASLYLYWQYGWLIIKNEAQNAYNFILSSTATPNWLLAIMAIPALLFIFAFAILLKNILTNSKPLKNSYKNYVSDDFFGLKWIWSYYGDGSISNLHSLCPHCDYQVLAKNISSYYAVPKLAFECDECNYSAGVFKGDYSELEQKVKLKIQKNLRTNEWKNKVKINSNRPN